MITSIYLYNKFIYYLLFNYLYYCYITWFTKHAALLIVLRHRSHFAQQDKGGFMLKPSQASVHRADSAGCAG